MQAGQLRHRITIQQMAESKTTTGGFAEAATVLYARIPAFVEPLSGRELNVAMQIDPRLRYQVHMRYCRGVKATQAVVYHAFDGDRTLEILQPPQIDEKDRSMVLSCGEATT